MTEPERLYYFTPTKYALEGVKNRRLKVAEMDKANDPFELLPFGFGEDFKSAELEKLSKDIQRAYSKELKIICFSETYKDPSLWGHYADKCRGVCLAFDIVELAKDMFGRIIYVEDRMDEKQFGFFSSTKEDKNEDESYDMRIYKSHHWKHESEWRLWLPESHLDLDPTSGLYFFPFAPPPATNSDLPRATVQILKLREIWIGFRCEEENIKRRFEKLTEQDPDPPEIFLTRRSASTFEIDKVT